MLLLDEPASGLSEAELPELGELIGKLAADASVVVIEHRMDLMMSVCKTITVLDFGKVIAVGTPAQVQADPAVTAAYLGLDQKAAGEQAGPSARTRSRAMSDAAALAIQDIVAGYGGGPVLDGLVDLGAARHHHGRPGRQRGRQDHAAADDQRVRPAAPRAHRGRRGEPGQAGARRRSPGPGSRTYPRARA